MPEKGSPMRRVPPSHQESMLFTAAAAVIGLHAMVDAFIAPSLERTGATTLDAE
jgi:hypothetical protein